MIVREWGGADRMTRLSHLLPVRPWLLPAASPAPLVALTQGGSAAEEMLVGLLHCDRGLNHNEYL